MKKNRIRCSLLVLGILMTTNAAQGDSPRNILVRVNLSRVCYRDDTVQIVIDGDETSMTTLAKAEKGGTGWWTFSWSDNRTIKFPLASLSASLRLGGARTYCRTATDDKDPKTSEVIAVFDFDCDEQPAKSLKFATTVEDENTIPIGYYRWLRKNPSSKKETDCSCGERSFATGNLTLPDVRFGEEKVFLQLGPQQQGTNGLLLFPISGSNAPALFLRPVNAKDPLVTSPAIKRFAKPIDGGLRLGRKGVEMVQLLRRGKPNGDFSVTAIDIDHKLLKTLKTVDVTVAK